MEQLTTTKTKHHETVYSHCSNFCRYYLDQLSIMERNLNKIYTLIKLNIMKLTTEQKAANKQARQEQKAIAKKFAQIECDKNQRPINYITFSIEWSKAGHPTCTAWIHYKDGTSKEAVSKAGGYGYCKESTVIAEIFNAALKYKLYQLMPTIEKASLPYGLYDFNGRFSFAGGVGTSCYYQIAEFIGGKFERVASGKTFDAFKFTLNEN